MLNNQEPRCDVLVISPHTDDAEIGLGGTLALLAEQGRRIWCVDLSRGELGTNDQGDERWTEAGAASAVLGLTGRIQLDLPDGFINPVDKEQALAIAWIIRALAPRWIWTAPDAWRHPDHLATPPLVEKASFLARLAALQPQQPNFRFWAGGEEPQQALDRWEVEMLAGVCAEREKAAMYFDVSGHWEKKLAALECYASQFQTGPGRQSTMINSSSFLDRVTRRAQMWGHRAGCQYAEALVTQAAPLMTDLPDHPWKV